jgi:hypothetical protein
MKRVSTEVVRLVEYAKTATPEELLEDYGVKQLPSGKLFDEVESKTFNSLSEWAMNVVNDDDYTPADDVYSKKHRQYDDEY